MGLRRVVVKTEDRTSQAAVRGIERDERESLARGYGEAALVRGQRRQSGSASSDGRGRRAREEHGTISTQRRHLLTTLAQIPGGPTDAFD
jgi:hypothetical protein